jgi:hypothetical protein
MEALKFLRPGRIAPITGMAWPPPGDWLDAQGPPDLCRDGIHALTLDSPVLAVWVAEELWRVELEDAEEVAPGLLAARRGRLLSRVEEWNDDTAREFARACAAHVQDASSERAAEFAADAKASAEDAVADFTTTTVAYMARHAAEATTPGGFETEKEWQSRWLADRLGLPISV